MSGTPYPVIGSSKTIVPFDDLMYPVLPRTVTMPDGTRILTYRSGDGVILAGHPGTGGGAVWIIVNEGTPTLIHTSADDPDGATVLDVYPMAVPGTNTLRIIMKREYLDRTEMIYRDCEDITAEVPVWSAVVEVPPPDVWANADVWLFYQMIPSQDGTKVLATAYGYENDTLLGLSRPSVALMESTTGGTWDLRSWISRYDATDHWGNEAALVRFPDGRLMSVIRCEINKGGTVATSGDDGLIWTPATLPIGALDTRPFNWMGQVGRAVGDYVQVFGRAYDVGPGPGFAMGTIRDSIVQGIYWWLLTWEGVLVKGPCRFDLVYLTSHDPDGGYCAIGDSADPAIKYLYAYTTLNASLADDTIARRHPCLLRYELLPPFTQAQGSSARPRFQFGGGLSL